MSPLLDKPAELTAAEAAEASLAAYRAGRRCELLSPAGDWDAMRAAVANGADAVYFGLDSFNARHRATNFRRDELPAVMRYLHDHNVKGFVTLNTLVFSDELAEVEACVKDIAQAGVDAVIVQDLGLCRLIREVAPTLEIHASTQMTLTEPRGIEYVRRLGVKRAVLARELAVDEIRKIALSLIERERATGEPLPDLEVFVHGALCVSYSGQCLTSESLGGRSANRGQCAQACRLPYELVVDGAVRDLGDKAYLLSPQDLAAYDLVEELVRLGVACLKIEGRLKSAHYVAATTQTYRAALDAAEAGKPFRLSGQQQGDLEQTFSRGFSHGFLSGVNHQTLVHARFPKSRGRRLGTVAEVTAGGFVLELERSLANAAADVLRPGDGIVFDEGHPEQDEQGGRVHAVKVLPGRPARLAVELWRGDVSLSAVSPGALVWKTDDPALRRRLEHSFARDTVVHRVPLTAHVRARVGEKLAVRMADGTSVAEACWDDRPLEPAAKHPVTEAVVREQLGRLGDTPFELGELTLDVSGGPMVPKSVLNDLRRRCVEMLLAERARRRPHAVSEGSALSRLRERARALGAPLPSVGEPSATAWRLHVLVRDLAQLDAVLAWRSAGAGGAAPGEVYADFEDVRRYREAVSRCRAAGAPLVLATVRVVKPREEGLLRFVLECGPDAVLVRNLAALAVCRQFAPSVPMVGDYSLNVANELTAELLAGEGLVRMVPSYDLSWGQMAAMFGRIDPGWFECVVHQHMPMFHMEHCVFSHLLSNGTDYRSCGRPCERHRVELRDRMGQPHPLLADVGCRNTVFNAAAQSALEYIPRMRSLGVRHFRVELLRERPEEVGPLLTRYADVLAGRADAVETVRSLRVLNQLGVVRGTLDRE